LFNLGNGVIGLNLLSKKIRKISVDNFMGIFKAGPCHHHMELPLVVSEGNTQRYQ
jgi:hypothetical protein